jgi:hypothetical protein
MPELIIYIRTAFGERWRIAGSQLVAKNRT